MPEITEEIKQNRIKAVAALREADESKRLIGAPINPATGNMCACLVIANGLDINPWGSYEPSELDSPDVIHTQFDYNLITGALEYPAEDIYDLNDRKVYTYDDEDLPFAWKPALKFAEIGDRLEEYWQ